LLLLAGGFLALLILSVLSQRADAASGGQLTDGLAATVEATAGGSSGSGTGLVSDLGGTVVDPVVDRADEVLPAGSPSATTQPADQGGKVAAAGQRSGAAGSGSRVSTGSGSSGGSRSRLSTGTGTGSGSRTSRNSLTSLTSATRTLAPVTGQALGPVAPLTRALQPALASVGEVLEPVLDPVCQVLAPVASGVGAGPLLPAPPGISIPVVGGLLDGLLTGTSAAQADPTTAPAAARPRPAESLADLGQGLLTGVGAGLMGATALPRILGVPGSGGRAPSLPLPALPAVPAAEGDANSLSSGGRGVSGGAAAVLCGLLLVVLWLSGRGRLESSSPSGFTGLLLERPG
jgi:hypothetical protein